MALASGNVENVSLQDYLKPQDQMTVSVYLAVTLEYMVGEVLELADSAAKAQEQDGITAILRIYHDMMQSCFCALIALSASSSGLATVYSNVAARLTAAPV